LTDIHRQKIDELLARSEALDSIADDVMQGTYEREIARQQQAELLDACRYVAESAFVSTGENHFLDLLAVL